MTRADRQRIVPAGLTGLAGAACAACCLLPLLLAAGVLGGAGWATAGRILPGVAVALVAAAGLAWWRLARRRTARCAGGDCTCGGHATDSGAATAPGREPVRSPA